VAFDYFDKDSSDFIDTSELEPALVSPVKGWSDWSVPSSRDEFYRQLDKNGDGRIVRDEFVAQQFKSNARRTRNLSNTGQSTKLLQGIESYAGDDDERERKEIVP